ncbi:hypothetical protein STEG23_035635, partial [Scotinomys teguina]
VPRVCIILWRPSRLSVLAQDCCGFQPCGLSRYRVLSLTRVQNSHCWTAGNIA